MRITTASGFVLLLALVAPVRAVPARAPSFLGEWTATASTPGGDVSETVTAVDIVLDGDKFSYKRLLITPGGTLVITYAGAVSANTFTGTAELGGFEVPYTGVRSTR